MEIKTILVPGCAQCATPGSKKKVLQLISELAAEQAPALSQEDVFEALLAREKMGSTGIGNGIAIPHGKLENIDKPIAVLVKCETPIPFDAIDNQPVDLLFALFVPNDDAKLHLKTLSQMAATLADKRICKQLRRSHTDKELYEAVCEQ
ncbi:PTS IIA-like nitrogen regulatory protein PtsN [Paraferrimonas sedimenticola]|uniref:PTS IIA-like nitrogen-regulatory protein PtsN n=1 Tax=Paraferrimonas sedimenticola TaxID=375674 RepID=A0AA37W0R9_9GAMM|nr:PTS IIA-like nitrogen regulatory protein PtsN [Paraferrimonas sedimenticola]GLP95833.1 PTS IIA-like nitrogen-regulatory protein PtsN [Paraferrimonas sedimenticola]